MPRFRRSSRRGDRPRRTARRGGRPAPTLAGPSSQSSMPTRRCPPRSSAARAIGVSSKRAAEHRDGPRHRRVAEHREEQVERLDDRRRSPTADRRRRGSRRRRSRTSRACPRGSAPCVVVREHDLQEAGFEDRDARPEPARRGTPSSRTRSSANVLRVHELAVGREAVAAGAAEVHRTGVARSPARIEAHVVEQLDVPVAIVDRLAEADGRVADRCPDAARRPGRNAVAYCSAASSGADDRVRRVRVDDRRARVDARERVRRRAPRRWRARWGCGGGS